MSKAREASFVSDNPAATSRCLRRQWIKRANKAIRLRKAEEEVGMRTISPLWKQALSARASQNGKTDSGDPMEPDT